jgi:hypothetical protein
MIRYLYRHMLEKGYLRPGDRVLDPFAGVACGALDAMQNGLHWAGVELEPRFRKLGLENIIYWSEKYRPWFSDSWGTAVLFQGDSRFLLQVLAGEPMGGLVSSPPYSEGLGHGGNPTEVGKGGFKVTKAMQEGYGASPGQLGTMPEGDVDSVISSPPYTNSVDGKGEGPGARFDSKYHLPENSQKKSSDPGYGDSPGNLGNMQDGDLDGVISSPPYAGSINSSQTGIDWDKGGRPDRTKESDARKNPMTTDALEYGKSPGQLGGMTEGDLDSIVSSPPYAGSLDHAPGNKNWVEEPTENQAKHGNRGYSANILNNDGYGTSEGNLGNMPEGIVSSPPYEDSEQSRDGDFVMESTKVNPSPRKLDTRTYFPVELSEENMGAQAGTTFWAAAAQIVAQCYQVLKPGGYAAWITGDFVRNKQRVEFGRQWLALCESVGFVPVEHIVCWKVEPGPTQVHMFDDDVNLTKSRVSFFRRLANKKNPDAAIESEDIWIVRKPE